MSYPHTTADCAEFHDLVRDFNGPRPKIAALCGSTRFRDEFTRINRELTLGGWMVLAPGVFAHDGDELTAAEKVGLDELHKRKIDLADKIVIVNPGGYVGDSTRAEIEYATKLGKPVSYTDLLASNFLERGEVWRRRFGIDGTAGDAQDVPHPYVHDPFSDSCVVCGCARQYAKHGGEWLDVQAGTILDRLVLARLQIRELCSENGAAAVAIDVLDKAIRGQKL